MATNEITALTDSRDNNTYLVAKLADGNCWFAENLRLNPATANFTDQNTNHPTQNFPAEASANSPTNSLCGNDNHDCDNSLQYNLNNLNRSLNQSYDGSGNNVAWYGYGAYYSWYTATANNNNQAHRMGLDIKNTLVTPEKAFNKWDSLVVRCVNN